MKKRRVLEVSVENPGSKRAPTIRISSAEIGKTVDRWVDKIEKSSSDQEYFATIRSRVVEEKDK